MNLSLFLRAHQTKGKSFFRIEHQPNILPSVVRNVSCQKITKISDRKFTLFAINKRCSYNTISQRPTVSPRNQNPVTICFKLTNNYGHNPIKFIGLYRKKRPNSLVGPISNSTEQTRDCFYQQEIKKVEYRRLNIINILAQHETKVTGSKSIENPGSQALGKANQLTSLTTSVVNESGAQENKNMTVELTSEPKSNTSYFFQYSRINEYKKLGVELASPETIRKWAERILPTGRVVGIVLNANTLHHKTLKPLKGGLFCERIFGPSKDFRCACGKTITKRMRLNTNTSYSAGLINLLTPKSKPLKRFFCKVCEVEYTWALTRRYQLGYISLAFPVTHIWFTKGFSNPISLLFDIHKYDLDSIIYCNQTTSIEKSYELTEMGISRKATQLLSFSRKKRPTNKLIQQQTHLFNVRFQQRNLLRGQKLQETKKITQFNSLYRQLQELRQTITDSSFKQIFNLHDERSETALQTESSSRSKTKLLLRRQKDLSDISQIKRSQDNSFYYRRSSKRNAAINSQIPENQISPSTFLLRSLLFPLVATFSIQQFAPFILWLLTVEQIEHPSQKRKPLNNVTNVSSPELKQYFDMLTQMNLIQSQPVASNGETNVTFIATPTFEALTEQIAVLKNLFIESLQLLQQLPDMSERKYHKYLITSRNELITLPSRSFKIINSKLYKTSYHVVLKLTKKMLNSFTDPSGVTYQKTQYFIKQLKNQVDLTESFDIEFNNLALQFLIYKLKKQQESLICTEKKMAPLLDAKYQSEALTSLSRFKSQALVTALQTKECSPIFTPSMIRKPEQQTPVTQSSISFYYNIYGVADDHLWENINDWNLTKSYLTVLPDIMDRVIPAYKHRIPCSTMTHLHSTETSYIFSNFDYQYLKPNRKYQQAKNNDSNDGKLTLLGRRQVFDIRKEYFADAKVHNCYMNQPRYPSMPSSFSRFSKPVWQQQALPIKATGAGIINQLLTSISLAELEAMDKHFSLLLRDSRKKILNYKTKIFGLVTDYALIQGLDSSSSQKQLGPESKLIVSAGGRSDRYSGIDKLMEKHHDLLRRAKIIRKFFVTKLLPKTMILKVLPVLPPDLRPIMKMADQIATSDLNRLYQRVLYRNERLNKIVLQLSESTNFGIATTFLDTNESARTSNTTLNLLKNRLDGLETPLFGYEKHYAQRLLQEAVDNLIDNGRAGANSEKDAKGRALKSLSEVLKGKQGRFRQYLLGKRVDYSGRSVIVVGPKLKIHQCGLPREMAVELYLPFIIQYLIQMKYTKTVVGAKTLIAKNKELINTVLENVVRGHPIILNRAPTLHRLGFQAFQPILVDGRAILLHPMACTAFNADFDGDQMAVHIPITIEARSEAWRLMLARNNLLSPATGDPIILPSQDMVLGCYYLTTSRKMKVKYNLEINQYFSDVQTVLYLYYLGKIHIHTPIWVKTTKKVITELRKKPLEVRISVYGTIQEIYANAEYYYDSDGKYLHQYIRTTPGRILFNLLIKKD